MATERRAWLAYAAAVDALADAATAVAGKTAALWLSEHPGATVEEAVDAVARIIVAAADVPADRADALARAFVRAVAAQGGAELPDPAKTETVPVARIAADVAKHSAPIAEGDVGRLVAVVSPLAGDVVNHRANAAVASESGGSVLYARVPTGDHPCPWCVTMASRGAVFRGESGAARLTKWHDHCRCKVVPTTDGAVEGYDPDAYLEQYQRIRELGADGYSQAQIKDFLNGTPVDELGPPNSGKGGRPSKSEG